jgi:hypothetical protein
MIGAPSLGDQCTAGTITVRSSGINTPDPVFSGNGVLSYLARPASHVLEKPISYKGVHCELLLSGIIVRSALILLNQTEMARGHRPH